MGWAEEFTAHDRGAVYHDCLFGRSWISIDDKSPVSHDFLAMLGDLDARLRKLESAGKADGAEGDHADR